MRKLLVTLALLAAISVLPAFWVLNTAQGLRWLIDIAGDLAPGELVVDQVSGRMVGPIRLYGVNYSDREGSRFTAAELLLDWQPRALLRKRLEITSLRADKVEIELVADADDETAERQQARTLPALKLPLAVVMGNVDVVQLSLRRAGADGVAIERAQFTGRWDDDGIKIMDLRVAERRGALAVRGSLRPWDDYAVDATMNWRLTAEDYPAAHGTVSLNGNTDSLLANFSLDGPAALKGEIEVTQALDNPSWRLRAKTAAPLSLRDIDPGWPDIQLAGNIGAGGNLNTAHIELTTTRPAAAEAVIELGPFDPQLRWQARVHTTAPLPLRDIDPGWPDIQLAGNIDAGGNLNTAHIELTTTRPAAAEAVIELGPFDQQLRWHAKLGIGAPVALESIRAEWPALALSGTLTASGDLDSGELDTRLRADAEEQSLQIEAAAQVSSRLLDLRRLTLRGIGMEMHAELKANVDLSVPAMPFSARGNWQELHWPLVTDPRWISRQGMFTADGDRDKVELSLQGSLEEAIGEGKTGDKNRLSLRVSAQDLRDAPQVTARAKLPYFAMPGLMLRDLAAAVQVDLTNQKPSFADISIATLTVSGQELTELKLTGSGTTAQHALKAQMQYGEADLALAAAGSWAAQSWQGSLTQLQLAQKEFGAWSLQEPVAMALAADAVELDRLCLSQGEAGLCGGGHWRDTEGWRGNIELTRLPTAQLGSLWRSDFDWHGEMSAELALSGGGGRSISGTARITAPEGSIHWMFDEEVNEVTYRDLNLSADISERQAVATLSGRIGDDGTLDGRVGIAHPFDDKVERSLDGTVSLGLPSLALLEVFLPDLHFHQGAFTMQLSMAGSVGQPQFSGNARIDDAQIDLKALGIGVQDLHLYAEMVDADRLQVCGSAISGRGTLTIEGHGELLDARNWSLNLHARGSEVEALNLPEAHIVASPDLRVGITATRLDLNGEVHIDEAWLKPELSTSGVTLSPDVVVITAEGAAEEERPKPVHAKVRMVLGDQVHLSSYGITAELAGQLDIAHTPGTVTTANGEIVIREGKYSIYGQSLAIERGRLVFTGGPVDDPGLDVRATRTAGDVTAGVLLSGTARAPEVELFSDPVLPDSEKLSYLLLGRPTTQANRTEGAMLAQAALAVLPGSAGRVSGQLQSTLGVDSFSVESDSGTDRGKLLVLGKYLSPRLFVSYGAGVAGALNVFRVRYELARRWLLTLETSSRESVGDILYSFER